MIWLSVKRDFFTGISSVQVTRKFHFSPQLFVGGITIGPLGPAAAATGEELADCHAHTGNLVDHI
jgi:hypothetical protein